MKKLDNKQSEPKSIMDMTPFELSQVDSYQRANRGFEDDSEEQLENYYDDL